MKFKNLNVVKKDGKGRPWLYDYEGYEIRKTGTSEYPYNIYKDNNHVGYERTIKDCIYFINNKNLDEGLLFEMANIPKEDTHLPYDIWLDSSGRDRNDTHTKPRIKVLFDNEFIPILIDKTSPDLPDSVKKIRGIDRISKQTLIAKWIIKHYDTLMAHWNKEISDREALNIIYKEDNR